MYRDVGMILQDSSSHDWRTLWFTWEAAHFKTALKVPWLRDDATYGQSVPSAVTASFALIWMDVGLGSSMSSYNTLKIKYFWISALWVLSILQNMQVHLIVICTNLKWKLRYSLRLFCYLSWLSWVCWVCWACTTVPRALGQMPNVWKETLIYGHAYCLGSRKGPAMVKKHIILFWTILT